MTDKTFEQRLTTVEERIEVISAYQDECDKLHKEMREHNKHSDDAINHNSEANMMVTRAINEINITLCKVIDRVENVETTHTPVIDYWRPFMKIGEDIKTTYKMNKMVLLWVVGGITSLALLVTAIKTLFY